ncbi:NAD-dependent epimerase [Methylotenera sp.]|uniref:NAD-dependent epimerase n=1 Tax=Methylotenera sp. TaxID=2051956 RepID=UPI002733979F|nr:NAD-dependent epimerase [Methylotenera sp.]MDP3212014.1 NAD-dependent epimerase [Methylotenera sp.]
MKILLTGVAGFIGMHVARILLERGNQVIGIDNLNDYYVTQLKHDRLNQIKEFANFKFIQMDIVDSEALHQLFVRENFQRVIHLAAQAGVRYSLNNPSVYIQSNLVGFGNILESCRHHKIEHLVYASSSSVYGSNSHMPFSVHDNVDHPLSLYAASKKSNELMAHAYSHLYAIPTTGLRYFTVYGPWGRPDMSPWLFTSAILEGKPINIFNHGKMKRDFTYIDDIAEGTVKVLDTIAQPNPNYLTELPDPATSSAPYRIYNIGNHQPEDLMLFIETLEKELGVNAVKNFMPMQRGDVIATYADVEDLQHDVGYAPSTNLQTGLKQWVQWYRNHAEGVYSQ